MRTSEDSMHGDSRYLLLSSIFSIALLVEASHAQVADLAEAELLLLRGNYNESNAEFARLLPQFPVQATLGLARGLREQGQYAKAAEKLERQLQQSPNSASLLAERALSALLVGDFDACRERVQQALTDDAQHVQARWVQAELWRVEGKLDEACDTYHELAQFYDRQQRTIQSPWQLYWLAKALAQHARFNQDQKRFQQLTSQLYPRLLSLEPNFWLAHHESGLLLLEKFNAGDAEAALNEALQINPQAADVRVGLARLALNDFELERAGRHLDRALQTNPNHAGALRCRADLELASLRPQAALAALRRARDINGRDPRTLGRTAAAHQLLTNPAEKMHREALDKLIETVVADSDNAGEIYSAWGEAMELARRYPQAGRYLRQAINAAPRLLGPRGRLGMIEMRLGHEDDARRWLEESFARDPYNVRVKNQLEVLDLLSDYATLETEHFIIRYDSTHDQLLAKHMARFVEPCYDQLASTFDFELPEKALLEVFHDGRGVQAREWFGARMVGLPNIHTIAACGGNVVAMVSPTAERQKLNWADILRHEIVHLINIQQTNYAVPHWLTEGCAVWQENRPRRVPWQKLLARRVPHGDVFDLESINLGFLRPRSADDLQLAYCQSEIYVQQIAEKHSPEGVRNLLSAYRANLSTEQAIARALGTTQEQVEHANVEYLSQLSAQLAEQRELRESPKLAEATARWETDSSDLAAGAELALVRLSRGDYPGAGRLAETVLARQPNQPLARYVKAQLLVRIGDDQSAAKVLGDLAEAESPQLESLKLLAGIHLRRGELDEARSWYQLGADRQPHDLQWIKALAVVAIRQHDLAELNRLLTRIANAEPDNLVARRKLLQLAKQNNQETEIERWAIEVLNIDPTNSVAMRAVEELSGE